MYNPYNKYPCPYFINTPWYDSNTMYDMYNRYMNPYFDNMPMYNHDIMMPHQNIPFMYNPEYGPRDNMDYNNMDYEYEYEYDYNPVDLLDYGPEPFVININEATKQNNTYRTALWTGDNLQLTLMSLNVGEDIGLEMHPDVDQFVRIEEGQGLVQMGDSDDMLDFNEYVYDDYVFIIPAGVWHNLTNIGNKPLKLYSIYAPPQHSHGTVHETKAEAAEEDNHG